VFGPFSIGLLIATGTLFAFQEEQTIRTYCVKAEDIIFVDVQDKMDDMGDNVRTARLGYTYEGTSYTPDGRLYLSSNETLDSMKDNIYVLPKDPSSIYIVTSQWGWYFFFPIVGVALYSGMSWAIYSPTVPNEEADDPFLLCLLVSHVVSYPLAVVYVQLRLSTFRNRFSSDDFQRDHDKEGSEEDKTETTMMELSSSSLATTDGTII
jgi:hypothetical protein